MPHSFHLVIQAPDLADTDVAALTDLAQARGASRLSAGAARLTDADAAARDRVAAYCGTRIDWAFVPAGARLADYKVLAMDMDSTLINIECIDEIADLAGLKAQVSAITEAAMRGDIQDFSDSLTRRVALLKGVPVSALQRVYDERLRLNPGAEKLLAGARCAGVKTLLVSGGFTFFTSRLRERLGLDAAHANELEIDQGLLTGRVLGAILDAEAKARHLAGFCARQGAGAERAIAMGDGANDLKMMRLAGISAAYHAKPVVRASTTYALNVCGLDAVLNWFEDSAAGNVTTNT